jgi:hypothetical protein
VIANDGAIKLHVNGKEVSGVSQSRPRKGYLALESEGSECHFRNIKIKELPSTNPKPAEVAKEWEGHRSLFTGIDLAGWKTKDGSWAAAGGHLRAAGPADLVSEKKFGAVELVFDWKMPAKAEQAVTVKVGDQTAEIAAAKGQKPGIWNRATVKAEKVRGTGPIAFKPAEGLELMNVFVREPKGK